MNNCVESFLQYCEKGGFPEFLENNSVEILQQLFNDILYRNVAVRYGIRNVRPLVKMTLFLISNVGKEYSLNKIRKIFGIGAANSVADYLNWFEDSYLYFTVPRFSLLVCSMAVNPKKIYTVNTAFARSNSLSFSHDAGRLLENMVFLHLRRHAQSISYFRQKYACDFIVRRPFLFAMATQVCYKLGTDNKDLEINGLLDVMASGNTSEGLILTINQQGEFFINNKKILVMPVWKRLE